MVPAVYFARTNLWHSLCIFPFAEIYFNDREGSDLLKKLVEERHYLVFRVEMYVENVLKFDVNNNL
jgi:hypothetical protein